MPNQSTAKQSSQTQPFQLQQPNPALPQDIQNAWTADNTSYQSAYNKPTLAGKLAQHPYLTALGGLLLAGPSGILAPAIAAKVDARNKNALGQAYADHIKSLLDNAKTSSDIIEPLGRNMALKNTLQNNGVQTPFADNVPVSDESMKNLLQGQDQSAYNNNAVSNIDQARLNAYNHLVHPKTAAGEYTNSNPQQLPPMNDDGTLAQGGVSQTVTPQAPLQPFHYVNPNLQKQFIMDAASAGNAGLTQGVDQYKFDKQSPSEILLRMSQANHEAAQARLNQLQGNEVHPNAVSERGLHGAQAYEAQTSGALNNRTPQRSYAPNPPQPTMQGDIQSLFNPDERKQMYADKATAETLSHLQTALGSTYVLDNGAYRPPTQGEASYPAYQNAQALIQGYVAKLKGNNRFAKKPVNSNMNSTFTGKGGQSIDF